ncbi:MAG: helicase, partial [Ruminococcaceae bacterium]|nr:helicase [Oscillospiraceae bacterium]
MLTLIIGRSGSGKTHHILRRMEELATAGEEKLLLIVPEQASFETEKHLAARLGAGKAEVYSFSRLCDLIFRQYGGFCRTGADTGDKLLLMKNILLTQPEQMSLYARQRKNTRFVSQLVELTDELRNAGVLPEELATAAQNA